MKRFIFFATLLLPILFNTAFAKGNAGTEATYESRYLVDMPNAGMLPKSHYLFCPKFIEDGGLLLDLEVAPFDFLNVGISYPIFGVIGDHKLYFPKNLPGFKIKLRVLGEEIYIPAIAIGFSSQGNGLYDNDKFRYEQLSPGFYLVFSKSFKWYLGEVSAHLGANYCVENKDNMGFNVYGGVEQTIGKYLAFIVEANPNFNDEHKNARLNFGIRAGVFENITVEWQFREVFASKNKPFTEMERYLAFEIIKRF